MMIKRYDAHTNVDDFKSDWHESKDGPMVKYKDYAALAAENAALKAAIEKHARAADFWNSWADPGDKTLHAIGTPATDDFMNEVRAQSITDALKSLDVVFDTDCVMEANGISYEDAEQRTSGAYAVSKALEEFASQLRKGVQP
ncbi:hypothetical protein A6J71_10225 [Enterobacter cancerogenus]|uniref:hypothetical protein n=1 Tax=Enterobacter cancerogenus TaxID=69218 RepID=UPI000C9B290D|nr:hypothetical protein [Enterobacter cancerogenus]PNF10505.1 hypothetical protein A6J71_10225 [Enterobacter cancerogenus]